MIKVGKAMTNEELFIIGDYDTLYTKNIPFMHHIAKRFRNLPIELDDLIGCGNLAFAKCLKHYNPTTSKWLTYFSKFMVNEILMFNRKVLKHSDCISLENITCKNKGSKNLRIEDHLSTGICIDDDVMDRISVEEILELTKQLPEREREALRLHLHGTRQVIIGEQLGISQAYVSRLIKKITNELYKQYRKGA